MLEDVKDRTAIRRMPQHFVTLKTVIVSAPHQNPIIVEVLEHTTGAAKFIELSKEQTDDILHLLIRFQSNTIPGSYIAGRNYREVLTPTRFVLSAGIESALKNMDLSLTHCSFQAKKQSIIVFARIIDSVSIAQQRTEHSTQFQQLMPVPAIPSKATHFNSNHDPDVTEGELRQQSLESDSALKSPPTDSKVIINCDDLLLWPSIGLRKSSQVIL